MSGGLNQCAMLPVPTLFKYSRVKKYTMLSSSIILQLIIPIMTTMGGGMVKWLKAAVTTISSTYQSSDRIKLVPKRN